MKEKFADRIKVPSGLWLGLQNMGVSAADLLRQARLPLAVFTHQGPINTRQYFALWQAMFDVTGDCAIGIKLPSLIPAEKLPPSLIDAYHARDFRDALQRMARYKRLCVPEHLELVEDHDQCRVEFSWLFAEQTEPLALVDASMATLIEIGRRGTGHHIKPRRVDVVESTLDVRAHEAYFGCRVRTGATHNRLYFHLSDLDRPFLTYNAELLEMLTPALDKQLAEYHHQPAFRDTVRWLLERQLSAGRPDILAVAQELGVSDRTLQRRLTEEGTHFQHLLSEVRRGRAHQLLSDPALDLTEVALLLGYEDQSSFFRAFKIWEGVTPATWRGKV